MAPLRRRTLLAGLGTTGSIGLSGCLSDLSQSFNPDTGDGSTGELTLPDSCPDPEEATEFRCGSAPPITASYDATNDERIAVNENGTVDVEVGIVRGAPISETTEFDDWATRTAGKVGARAAIDVVERELEDPLNLAGAIGGPGEQIGAHFWVGKFEPGDPRENRVTVDEVVAVAPAFVTTTITLREREVSKAVPVYITLELRVGGRT